MKNRRWAERLGAVAAVVALGQPALASTAHADIHPLDNGGFELGAAGWRQSSTVPGYRPIGNQPSPAAHSGTWKAVLGGHGVGADTVSRTFTVPAFASTRVSYWLHVEDPRSGDRGFRQLVVALTSEDGVTYASDSFTNKDWTERYERRELTLPDGFVAAVPRQLTLTFLAAEGVGNHHPFLVDDVDITTTVRLQL
ncbi:hypothetical protein OG871_03670 [Kitasatospora sp. NBC_00374]|uniref:hypothetical protein n=1 Tax=Kitasatospora sp. NBC_00374 TaxID=2975964 RepID=UPI00324DC8BF